MKLWEVMKELTEDPKKKFEAKLSSRWTMRMSVNAAISRYFKLEVFYDTKLIDPSSDGGGFDGNISLDDDWQLVRQPVTWQEAIEARADGKRVRCEFNDRSWSVAELVVNHLYFRAALDDGKWYVED